VFGLIEFLTGGKRRKEAARQLSFDDAIAAHEKWKERLLNIAGGNSPELISLNIDDIRCDDKCTLGIWIHEVAKDKFGKDQIFADLLHEHAAFHICAADVIEHAKRKRLSYSRAIINGSFTRISQKVVRLLEMLRSKYARL
jgi:hypothetical protein